VGSPVLNNNIFPQVAGFLTYMKGLKPKKRYSFCFGSYGWSKVGFRDLEQSLQDLGIELISEGRYFQYIPSSQELESLKEIVVRIKEILKSYFLGKEQVYE